MLAVKREAVAAHHGRAGLDTGNGRTRAAGNGGQRLLAEVGFRDPCRAPALFHPPREITGMESMRPGHGEGGFVVVRVRAPLRNQWK